MTSPNHSSTEIIVVGAGLVGMAFANLVAQQGRKVHLVDRGSPPEGPVDMALSGRIHAYNLATQALLQKLDVWQELTPQSLAPFKGMEVVARNHATGLSISAQELDHPYLGHFIASTHVLPILYQRLREFDQVSFSWECTATKILQHRKNLELNLNNDTIIEGRILVGADGARSWVRQQTSLKPMTYNYKQRCLVGFVEFDGDHMQTAWQRFLPTGPLGLLPLNNNHFSLAWSLDQELADKYQALSDKDFLHTLFSQQLPSTITKLTGISKRQSFPLHALHCRHYFDGRVVLIGDAAHAIHPLAGLGMNLGMKDAESLAVSLLRNSDALSNPQLTFTEYQRSRKQQNATFLHTMTAFQQFFSATNSVARLLQSQLLQFSNQQPLLKKLLASYATSLDFTTISPSP